MFSDTRVGNGLEMSSLPLMLILNSNWQEQINSAAFIRSISACVIHDM